MHDEEEEYYYIYPFEVTISQAGRTITLTNDSENHLDVGRMLRDAFKHHFSKEEWYDFISNEYMEFASQIDN